MDNSRRKILAEILLLLVGLGMVGAAFWFSQGTARMRGQPSPDVRQQDERLAHRRLEFFTAQITPLIEVETGENLMAIHRAEQRLNELFRGYCEGVPGFVEELTSWGMRYQISKTALRDWWSKTNRTAQVGTELFARRVVSDERLRSDIQTLVAQLASDFEANRNQMLIEASTRLRLADFSLPNATHLPLAVNEAFARELKPLLESRARQSPMISVLALGSSVVAEEGTRLLVTAAMRMLTASLSATAASAGGATAASAAGGATGGTVLSPGVGTAIGIAAGIVVGVAVDWWMESRFKEKVTAQCRQVLRQMQNEIWSNQRDGLKVSFELLANTARECHLEAMRRVITGGA
jgi:hypothetical protein